MKKKELISKIEAIARENKILREMIENQMSFFLQKCEELAKEIRLRNKKHLEMMIGESESSLSLIESIINEVKRNRKSVDEIKDAILPLIMKFRHEEEMLLNHMMELAAATQKYPF